MAMDPLLPPPPDVGLGKLIPMLLFDPEHWWSLLTYWLNLITLIIHRTV